MDTDGIRNNRRVRNSPGTGHEATGSEPESLGTIVAGIVEDLQGIVRGEVQLAKTELKEDASAIGRAATLIAIAAIVGLVGFSFLMLGVTYLLNKSLQMWLSAGIVGVVLLIIALIAAMVGKNQLSAANLKPQQTIDSLKEDQEWTSRQIKSVKK
ncbi:MAG: phage holin family protein [Thermomicrobiales bacterium]